MVDLFCGAGGLSEGFRQAGFRVIAGSDIDPDACATYRLNFPEALTVYGDIREPAVREAMFAAAAQAQIVVGGPPCQAFSQVRNHSRLIDDPRNSLYREFVAAVKHLNPLGFVMENVPGMAQMGVKEQVLQDLGLDGEYQVTAEVLDAADFGVAQTRKRIIFVGIHRSLRVGPPIITGSGVTRALRLRRMNGGQAVHYRISEQEGGLAGSMLSRLTDPWDLTAVTTEQAIGDLALLRAGIRCDELAPDQLPAPQSAYQKTLRGSIDEALWNTSVPRINEDTRLRLAGLPEGGNHRDLPEELLERYLTGQRWGPHNGSGRLERRHFYAYRRLHPGFWSWTLNTKADSVYHYSEPRVLSVREFARVQSFRDGFRFVTDPRKGDLLGRIDGGPVHSRYRQAGNAVPPLLAAAVAKALAKALEVRQAILPHDGQNS